MLNTNTSEQDYLERALDNPIFIIGSMRSGTSFLGLQLNQVDSIIGCPFELRKVWSSAANVPMASDIIDTCCPGLDETDVWEGQAQALRSAFKFEMLNNLGTKSLGPDSRFLNKCPHLCNKLRLVSALFPNATYIWTIRSLLETVVSIKNLFERPYFTDLDCYHLWPRLGNQTLARCFAVRKWHQLEPDTRPRAFPGGNIIYLAEYWLESNLAVANQLRNWPKNRCISVSHEDVVTRPDDIAEALEHKLGLAKGQCQYIVENSDQDKTKRWNNLLSDGELVAIDKFKKHHQSDIDEIYNCASTIRC